MAKKIRKMAILAKVEAIKGQDALPAAANAMLVSDVTLTPLEGDEVERANLKPFFGNSGSIMVTAYKKVSFSVEMASSGTLGTAPGYAPLMRACGMSVTTDAGKTVTFAPVSEAIESVTLYANVDGINHVMLSAQGEVKATVDAKGLPKWGFEFTGLFVPLADAPLPAPVYTAFQAPLAVNKANSTLNLHGLPLAASAFSFVCGNKVVKRDLMTVDSVEITDRSSSGSVTFENTSVATKDWVGAALASARGPLKLVHGTQPGSVVEFNAPLAQLKKPSYSDSDGIQMITVPMAFVHGPNGNDEWSIVIR